MHDAREVANFLLDYADQRLQPLTNMALLKHIYFAHGWHLAAIGGPLISNRVEAWQYGPVIRSVYECFKSNEDRPIVGRAEIFDLSTGEIVKAEGDFSNASKDLMKFAFEYYSRFTAFELSSITHEDGGPWDRVWNRGEGKVQLNMEITDSAIREHFLKLVKSTSIQ